MSRGDLTLEERDHVIADIVREITALWQTDELRRRKPTPVDGAYPSPASLISVICKPRVALIAL